MEQQFFKVTGGWDQHDVMDFSFYGCTLRQDLGEFKKGHKFSTVYISYAEGWMECFGDDPNADAVAKFALTLNAS